MNEQLYIMVMGEHGKTVQIPCSKKKILISSAVACLLLIFLIICTGFSISLFSQNREISIQLADLQYRMQHSDEIIAEYQRIADKEKLELSLEVANLKLDNANQEMAHKEEKEQLLSTAVSELNERSEIIETIISNIGAKVSDNSSSKKGSNSGGPFIPAQAGDHDKLIFQTDTYLDTIRFLPLGRPVEGPVTSRFGKRSDPLNKKNAFHEGVDFRGKRGERIYATADGVVKRACKNGSFGNYVEIDHRNGYTTAYAHMQNYIVKEGERVSRGQLIGQIGNSGRSTGPHLHYEIRYKKKPVNPSKYMQVAKLLKKKSANAEKK
jgi:murein DD-endopeptidase MepM/ murein hydrolase activator NlpD